MPRTLGTPSVTFELQIKKGREKEICPIRAVMVKSGTTYRISIGDGCKPGEWVKNQPDPKKGNTPQRRAELAMLAETLLWWSTTMKGVWEEYHKPKLGMSVVPQISEQKFRELVLERAGFATGKEEKVPTLLEFARQYVAEREREKGEKHPTVNGLRYGLKNLNAYCEKYGEVNYDHINFEWLERFRPWLFQRAEYRHFKRKALNQNSAAQVVSAIKQFISEARKKEYTKNTLVTERGFSVKKSETNKAAFYLDELEQIYRADLSKHPQKREMERTRILLFVGAFSGMRFSDYGKLKKELVHVENGEPLLNVFAQKTKREIGIPFIPLFQTVLEQANWVIPKMAVQRFNENLKELCKYVGLERKVLVMESVGGKQTSKEVYFYEVVSSHCCRRFFISTMLLLGVPASQIMPITGHGTERQLRSYAAIENRQNAVNISKQFRKGMMEFLGITNE